MFLLREDEKCVISFCLFFPVVTPVLFSSIAFFGQGYLVFTVSVLVTFLFVLHFGFCFF